MRVLRGAAPVALAVRLCTGTVAAAHASGDRRGITEAGARLSSRAPRLAGASGGELLAQWIAQPLAIPAPQTYEPMCLHVWRHGDVLAPGGEGGETSCTMRAGTPLLLVGDASECVR